MLNFFNKHKYAIIILAFLLLIAGIAHAYNMFHYPYFEDDEDERPSSSRSS